MLSSGKPRRYFSVTYHGNVASDTGRPELTPAASPKLSSANSKRECVPQAREEGQNLDLVRWRGFSRDDGIIGVLGGGSLHRTDRCGADSRHERLDGSARNPVLAGMHGG